MKLGTVSDIHQMNSKWKEVVKACYEEQFDVLAVAGDIFPKDNGILYHPQWFKHFKRYAQEIKDTGTKMVLTLGNDDNQLLIPEMEKGHEEGLWYYLDNSIVEIDGYEFVGMPYVPDYPFGYKFWCHGEYNDHLRICPQQFGKPILVGEDNKFYNIRDLEEYFKSKQSIHGALVDLTKKVEDIEKSIWLIHAPPSGMGLDLCAHGETVGSDAVLDFIEESQPMLTIHGHIHEAPEYNGNKWKQECHNTLCIQNGQVGFDLYYSVVELEKGEIISAKHSIYN